MSYDAGTILVRKDPQTKTVSETNRKGEVIEKEVEDPYNEVRVVGFSPVTGNSGQQSEWSGQASANLTITPTDFGGPVDKPFGELQRDYEVLSVPERAPHAEPEPPRDPHEDKRNPEEKLNEGDPGDHREMTPLA